MFLKPEQLSFINNRLQEDTIIGYTYDGCGMFNLQVDEYTKIDATIFKFSQRMFPYFNDVRKDNVTNTEIAIYFHGSNFIISEIAVHDDAPTTVQFLKSLREYKNTFFDMQAFKESLPLALDDRFYFNETFETLNLKSENYLNSLLYGINELLGARSLILTMGLKLQ
ncbi:hypothetical protein [Lactobacillus sp. Sy-1]|uniref:hypothetical protein n=1 Tax=Lactobacillus sp. Sy-1 TaxID=2109645 RepID=UPI001C5BE092|nr:hypothetical protein [Lactobacillus sp. Sy-1]MBW1605888.1 hypothetical protein [Lactobacillus sp. Sy-1]